MSDHHGNLHNPSTHGCSARSRRRPASARRHTKSLQRPVRDVCPQRSRLLDPDHEAFVEWFVAYWRGQGAQLFAGQPMTEEVHTDA